MDQEPLVSEQIDAGKTFLDAFEKQIPVSVAFWLKAGEDSGWYLYVASDRIIPGNVRAAYGEVLKVSRTIQDPNYDQFRVKLIASRDPLARAALDIYRRTPARKPMRIGNGHFGGMSVEGVYIYPPPAPVSVPSQ
jgi:hypothetical protein